MKKQRDCPICEGSSQVETIWELPALPQSERFGSYAPDQCPSYDQELLRCECCSHVFLKYQLDPKDLYQWGSYKFRSAISNTAKARNHFFADYWNELTDKKGIKHIADVGGNDLYLINLLKNQSVERKTVIDPIWSDDEREQVDGIYIKGVPIENYSPEVEEPPIDAVASAHTFEHLPTPLQTLTKLFEETEPGTFFLIEIPDWDSLLEAQRLDCVFHQHYHYFSLRSLTRLIENAGGTYLDHRYNPFGTCGGSLLVACQKRSAGSSPARPTLLPSPCFKTQKAKFEAAMAGLRCEVSETSTPVYGYGASLLLATFMYHLRPPADKIQTILDDDPNRHNSEYQNVPVRVRNPDDIIPGNNATILVTSIENQRAIYRRACDFAPKRLLHYPIS